ncbi:MAG: extracellular solute-binding protein [Anaerolineae bacterium]
MKRPFITLSTIMLLTVSILLLSSCVAPPAAAPQPAEPAAPAEAPKPAEEITVILPKHEADLVGFWPARVKEFEEQTGIKVTLINMSWDKAADKVLAEMAAGGDAYDVIEFDNSWVAKFRQADWLEPLDTFMPADYTKDMVPGLVDLFSDEDNTYGLVWNNDIRFFFYNADILEQAGIDTPPTTWDELVVQCKTIQEKGIVEHCLAQPWVQEWAIVNEFHFFTYTFGGEMLGEGNSFLWNTDGAAEALQFMVDIIQKDEIVNPASLTFSQEDAMNVFLSGDAAFFPQAWPGAYAFAQDESLSKIVGKVKVGLVPGKEPGMSAALALPEAMAIPKNSKHKEAAWKFIEFMTSKPVNKLMALEIGAIPIYVDLYNDPELVDRYPYWKEFGAQLDTAQGLMQTTWLDQWGQVTMVEIQKALAGHQTAQEALDAIYAETGEFEGQP